jgi:hypothetical protein
MPHNERLLWPSGLISLSHLPPICIRKMYIIYSVSELLPVYFAFHNGSSRKSNSICAVMSLFLRMNYQYIYLNSCGRWKCDDYPVLSGEETSLFTQYGGGHDVPEAERLGTSGNSFCAEVHLKFVTFLKALKSSKSSKLTKSIQRFQRTLYCIIVE